MTSPVSIEPLVQTEAAPPLPTSTRRTRRRAGEGAYPGARIARVAVDDATWEAFRSLCGSVPASIRLGELVAAEVKRATDTADDAVAARVALREIQSRASDLERYLVARTH